MKRSNSKKDMPLKTEDGSQQKISSFFQKSSAMPAQSKLFSNVKKMKPALPMKKPAPKANAALTGIKSKAVPTDKGGAGPKDGKTQLTVLKDFNASADSLQPGKTPEKQGSKADPGIQQSPEIVVIPDTPEDQERKPKLKSSRSFLCPVNMLTSMPGKRVDVAPKVKQKRVVKKPQGTVSVEFAQKQPNACNQTKQSESNAGPNVVSKATCSDPVQEKAKIGALCSADDVDFADFSFEQTHSLSSSDLCPDGEKPPVERSGSGQSLTPVKTSVRRSLTPVKTSARRSLTPTKSSLRQSLTPTKSYAEGKSVKRMAFPGLSPDPKRAQPEPAALNEHSAVQPLRGLIPDDGPREECEGGAEPSASRCVMKAKRQLALLTGFKDVGEMNKTINNYQLGGGNSSKSAGMSASSDKDDVLEDILGQLRDVPQPADQPMRPKPHPETETGHLTAVTKVSVPEQKMEVDSLASQSQEDDDVLDEILDELKKSLSAKKETSPPDRSRLRSLKRNDNCSARRNILKIPSKKDEKESTKGSLWQSENTDKSSSRPSLEGKTTKVKQKKSEEEKMDVSQAERFSKVPADMIADATTQGQGKRATPVDPKGNIGRLPSTRGQDLPTSCLKATMESTPSKLSGKSFDHGLGDLRDLDEELAGSFDQMSPFKDAGKSQPVSQKSEPPRQDKFTDKWNRFVVQEVSFDRQAHTTVLEVSKEGGLGNIRKVLLKGFWCDTQVEKGDIIHLLFEDGQLPDVWGEDDPVIVDDNRGQIVVNPDLLLSGTAIVSGVYCLRRAVLNEKFKGVDSKNIHMLYGSVIHSLFQEVLKYRLTKTEEILSTAKSIVQSSKFLHEMYSQSATESQVMEEIQAYVAPLQTWLNTYLPPRDASHKPASDLTVVQIHDIEETIWSPRLGVKGKIDLTVEVETRRQRGAVKRKILPLELKTGRASHSAEHKGQVTLYSLMTSERREDPEEGLLLYLKHNDMTSVPVKPENTRGLLQLRNEMAYYVNSHRLQDGAEKTEGAGMGRLPPPINSQRACPKCPHLLNCAVYQQNVEHLSHSPDHAMSSLVPDTLSHLGESHLRYFTHWLLCMNLEASSQRSQGLRSIWCMASNEREQRGDCLQQLVMVDSVLGVPETQAYAEGRGCCVQFQRRPGFSGLALSHVGLAKNDSVVLSSEDGRYIALSTGFIRDITDTVVEVVVDRDSFHENTSFQSLVFRIDRCDVFNTSGYLLTNLSRLMESSAHGQKLRSLVIDLRKPEFQLKMSKSAVEKVKKIFRPLNKPQKTAILKVLLSLDFVLIKGYPGTGKTSTIVALVKILKELGHSVLLTGYTHSSVDNILIKLKKDGIPFLRLGRTSRIHPFIHDHAAETLTLGITSVDELRSFYSSYDIVATSCLGTNHALFGQRRFDVCIVDEASQVLQPACLGPLLTADRFVLVGDPQQLPPVVQSRAASALGMGESLFARLDGSGATYDLHLQYRMNKTVMRLSNELVYSGALQCGSDAVAQACIQPVHSATEGREWLGRALDTDLTNAVVFLDTRQMAAAESSDSRGLINAMEADLILHLAQAFVEAGIPAGDIGVIAPYRAQVRLLQQRLSQVSTFRELEVNTVDQYQGRDKAVIFISFVRSSSADVPSTGTILHDVRRLNVALTRAKHKLVLVGDSSTLHRYEPVSGLLENLQSRQQIFLLPSDCTRQQ